MSLSLPRGVPVPGGAPSALPPRRQRLSRSAPSSPAARAASTQQHDHQRHQLLHPQQQQQPPAFSGKAYPSQDTVPLPNSNNKQQQLIYESPRLEFDDHHLFPNAQHHHALRQHDTRWRYLQQVAGQHRQDAKVLDLSKNRGNCLTPAALASGTPAAVARRVTELRLNVLGGNGNHRNPHYNPQEEASLVAELPLWLDAIDETFPALRHLSLQAQQRPDEHSDDNTNKNGTRITSSATATLAAHYDSDGSSCSSKSEKSSKNDNRSVDKYAIISNEEEEETTLSDHEESTTNNTNNKNDLTDAATVRRLYVLYRLPRLESLDGVPVRPSERRLALPRDRQQERQQAAAAAATNKDTALLDKAVRAEAAVEVDLDGQPHSSDASDLTLSPTKRRTTTNNPPPLHPLMDDDDDEDEDYMNRIEYESVESTQVCEWSAACGMLPYFRKAPPDRAKTKSRFHLKFRKPQQQSSGKDSSSGAATATHTAHSNHTTTTTTAKELRSGRPAKNSLEKYQNHRKSLSVDPVMHVEDMSDHGEMIFEARPQRRRRSSGAATPPPVQTQLLESDDAVAAARVPPAPLSKSLIALQSLQFDLKGRQSGGGSPSRAFGEQQQTQYRQPPSHSLTSPFPMQFRVRAREAVVAKELTVSTDFDDANGDGDDDDDDERHREVSPPPAPRDTIVDTETTTTRLASRIALTRTRSSPTKLPSSWPTVKQQHTRNSNGGGGTSTAAGLPPPFPESKTHRLGSLTTRYHSNNNMVRSSSSKASKSKRRASRWRAKIVARKSSIMDTDDDDDDDGVDSSEEENLVTYANV